MTSGRSQKLWLVGALVLSGLAGLNCAGKHSDTGVGPTRGYILISLDTLGADHLGAYGYDRATSPFFDRLAERGTLFEQAIIQYPSTLVSHVSMFTGLYPQEHGVYPPLKTLSPDIEVVPERFSHFGFLTAGHTEGGFVGRHYGFHRGFDEFSDPQIRADTDIEQTFAKGVEFLSRLESRDKFFLFLHSQSAHAPYQPPAGFESPFAGDPALPEPAFDSVGANIRAANAGFQTADRDTAEAFRLHYDAGVRYIDSVLETFFAELERLGLVDDVTVVITSDHGEEFLEHGRLGHSQVYPENLRVPLLVLHPALETGRRVPELVQSIDLAPTLYELANIPPSNRLSGQSLVPYLEGATQSRTIAYAEVRGNTPQQTLLIREEGTTYQFVSSWIPSERDGTWVTRKAGFDTTEERLALDLVSFERPRLVRASITGPDLEREQTFEVSTGWSRFELELGPVGERHRVHLASDSCDSPRQLGVSDDRRCLSFKVRGVEIKLRELFDLNRDKAAQDDLGSIDRERFAAFDARLSGLGWSEVARADSRTLSDETRETLQALGYID